MIVAATKNTKDPWQQPERFEIRPDLPDRRPRHRADEHDVAATLPASDPAEPAELAQRRPVVRISGDALRIRPTADRKQHDRPAVLGHSVGNRERQAAAAANDGERTVIHHCGGGRLAHGSSPTSTRRAAIVNGCEPARMNSIILMTSGSPTWAAATASSRSRKVPVPKHSAS